MPDRNYENLADKGWMDMENILDKEMPVKRDRKWAILLLLLFVVALGGYGLYFYNANGNSTKQALVSEKTQTANVVEGFSESTTNIDKEEHAEDLDISNGHIPVLNEITEKLTPPLLTENDKTRNNKGNILTSKNSTKSEPAIKKIANVQFAKTVTNPQESSPLQMEKSPSEASTLATSSTSSSEIVNEVKQPPSRTQPLPSLTLLPSLDLKILDTDNTIVNFNSILVSSVNSVNHPLYFKVIAGYALPITSSNHGPYAGISFEKMINRRWSLESGVGILNLLQDFNFSSRNDDRTAVLDPGTSFVPDVSDPLSQDQEYFGENSIVSTEYYDLIESKISSATYLYVPLNVNYQLALKHKVGLGVSYAYLAALKNRSINLAELESSLSANTGVLGSKAILNANVVNRHHLLAGANYRYELNRNIGINAQFNLGINDIIRTDASTSLSNRINYFGIGIDYRLKM